MLLPHGSGWLSTRQKAFDMQMKSHPAPAQDSSFLVGEHLLLVYYYCCYYSWLLPLLFRTGRIAGPLFLCAYICMRMYVQTYVCTYVCTCMSERFCTDLTGGLASACLHISKKDALHRKQYTLSANATMLL